MNGVVLYNSCVQDSVTQKVVEETLLMRPLCSCACFSYRCSLVYPVPVLYPGSITYYMYVNKYVTCTYYVLVLVVGYRCTQYMYPVISITRVVVRSTLSIDINEKV
jgi:hypothetical protein